MSDNTDRHTTEIPEVEQTDEYTRLSMTIQRGDGIDRRGDVTVDIKRDRPPRAQRTNESVIIPTEPNSRDGSPATNRSQSVTVDHETFAEFYHEVQRATHLLEQRLGLLDDDDGAGNDGEADA